MSIRGADGEERTEMPGRLILLCGVAGAGKTTLVDSKRTGPCGCARPPIPRRTRGSADRSGGGAKPREARRRPAHRSPPRGLLGGSDRTPGSRGALAPRPAHRPPIIRGRPVGRRSSPRWRMFAVGAGRRLRGMRRRLMFVITALVITGVGCASADAGTGATSPPTGTTLVPAAAATGALPAGGHDSGESR